MVEKEARSELPLHSPVQVSEYGIKYFYHIFTNNSTPSRQLKRMGRLAFRPPSVLSAVLAPQWKMQTATMA
jgi:hypothetical protein